MDNCTTSVVKKNQKGMAYDYIHALETRIVSHSRVQNIGFRYQHQRVRAKNDSSFINVGVVKQAEYFLDKSIPRRSTIAFQYER